MKLLKRKYLTVYFCNVTYKEKKMKYVKNMHIKENKKKQLSSLGAGEYFSDITS